VLARTLAAHGVRHRVVGTLEAAVPAAWEIAHRVQGVVLLAPACASFDQFESYEHRGRVFKQLVNGLKERT